MAHKGYRQKKSKSKADNHDVLGVSLIIVSLFLLLCIVIPPILSVVSEAVFSIVLGIFGIAAYPALIATLMWGIFLMMRRPMYVSAKNIVCIALLLFFALIIFQLASTHAFLNERYSAYIADVYSAKYSVGGVIMGTVAFGLKTILTEVGCYIIFSFLVLVVVAIMANVISRIRALRVHAAKEETAKMPPAPNFTTRMAPQNVMPVEGGNGLFVGTIERRMPPAITTETGRASEIAESETRVVTDYGEEPVMMEPKTDKKVSAAHVALYGDSDAVKKKAVEEYMRNAGAKREERNQAPAPAAAVAPQRAEYAEQYENDVVEPYIRTAVDAKANVPAAAPKKIVHDSHKVVFPVEKHLEFNDDGIENADDLKYKLREDAKKRKWNDIESAENREREEAKREEMRREDMRREEKRTPPEVFMPIKRNDAPVEPVNQTPIIDADLDRSIAPPTRFDKIESKPAATRESVDDRFLRALERSEKEMPRFEPDPIIQDDIINTDMMRGSSYAPEPEPVENDIDPDDIVIGDEKPSVSDKRNSVFKPTVSASVADDDIIGDDSGIVDGSESDIVDGSGIVDAAPRLSGLSVVDAPAVDMTERHDITSDLIDGEDNSGMYTAVDEQPVAKPSRSKKGVMPLDNQISIQSVLEEKSEETVALSTRKRHKDYGDYVAPPIDLLKKYDSDDMAEEDLKRNAQILETVISGFVKSPVTVINIVPGPTVTRYELECQTGVPVKQIESHSQDIEYELASISHIRIEAPIPGKRAIGIEVPNAKKSIVGIRDIIESNDYARAKSPMTFAVGKDISGDVVLCDLEKVPHLLIAGQTGSGKSACLNGLIVSLLYKSSPADLRFILVDPKRVEFSAYAGMPHLLFNSIIYEPNEVLNALKWGVNEMERRYALLQKYRCNQLSAFNKHPEVVSGKIDKLPHIIIIIDELADIMQSAVKRDIEDRIKTIAAKARAAGIHLIVATQRPSADVLTGTIKTNLTSRIAFKVSGQLDSRIILDVQGAEALVGKGDMLFFPVEYSAPKRVQGSFISDEEVALVLAHIKDTVLCDFDDDAMNAVYGSDESSGNSAEVGLQKAKGDPLLPDVLSLVIRTKQASTSSIQRRFSIGFARASRIMDIMEEQKYIGPATGNSKPREVYITNEQYREMFGHDADDNN